MRDDELTARVSALEHRLGVLETEAEIRRVQARYMFLCDTPCPEPGIADDSKRIDRIMELYAPEAVWEGVGEYYEGQFGRAEGAPAIRAHFERFWGEKQDPPLLLNAHYLTAEQIHVDGETAEGQWIHMQPWVFADGTTRVRSSRLNNAFRREGDRWLITRTRTENVLIAELPKGVVHDMPATSVLMED